MINKRSTRRIGAAALLTGMLMTGASGQPGAGGAAGGGKGQAQGSPGAETAPAPAMTRERLRTLIDRELEQHRQALGRLDEAAKKLDKGGDPAAIGRELVEQARENRRAARTERPAFSPPDEGARPARAERAGGEYEFAGPRLSAEEHAKVLKHMEEKHPQILQKVSALGGKNQEMTDRLIDGVGGRLRWIESMREKEKDEFELRLKDVDTGLDALRLGRVIADARKTGDAAVEAGATPQLRRAMQERFDTRQELSRLKLRQLRKQADDLERQLAANDHDREAVIERRTQEFLKLMDARAKHADMKGDAEKPRP